MRWIHEALDATQKATIRYRRLPAELVVQIIIAMALYRSRSMSEVIESLDLVLPDGGGKFVSKSAITQARQRLGAAPMEALFRKSSEAWASNAATGKAWKGLSLWGMDGTSLRTPDSPRNRSEFSAQVYQSGKVASYPQVRLVTLSSIPTRMVVDASYGRYPTNEMRYAEELIERIPDNSLTVFDKGFYSARLLWGLTDHHSERHFLIPARKDLRYEILSGSADDAIVQMTVSAAARRSQPELPRTWTMRMVRYNDSKGHEFHLLTSLLDKNRYPACDLLLLYAQRWELETSYREIKVWLAEDSLTLRSMSPETIRQEIWGTLTAYNLVRMEMAMAVEPSGASPRSASFVRALHFLQDKLILKADRRGFSRDSESLLCRRQRQLGSKLNGPTNGRNCQRMVKARPKRYPEWWVREARGSPLGKRKSLARPPRPSKTSRPSRTHRTPVR